uniref:Ovule protein n=1 Tax=Strongyloides papillosus TaxID=174720 RepID=A0A0N5BCG5_STREA
RIPQKLGVPLRHVIRQPYLFAIIIQEEILLENLSIKQNHHVIMILIVRYLMKDFVIILLDCVKKISN